MSLKNHFIEEN